MGELQAYQGEIRKHKANAAACDASLAETMNRLEASDNSLEVCRLVTQLGNGAG